MNRILNKDDLTMILNDKTSKGNIIGRVLLIDADDTYVYNQRTERIEVYKDLFEPNFIYQLLNAENIRKKIISSAQGNTQIYINWSIISNFNYFVPLTKSEQKHLANFFDYFDNLITLHQRKLDKLKNIKKSMLEKMFPKNGSNIPEIRFKGFTDAWEQRKLGEVALSFEYGLNVAAKEYDGVNKYLRITDIDDESHNFKNNELTSPDIDLTNAYNFRLHEGDILFSRTGASVGKTFIYKKSDGIVYFAGFLIRARIKSEYDAEFIFQNTLCSKYEKYIKITSQRSGQPGVNAQEYAEYSFLIPKYKEQKQIGKYFYYLDNLITLHQRKLEKLQNIKKACLEKMFV